MKFFLLSLIETNKIKEQLYMTTSITSIVGTAACVSLPAPSHEMRKVVSAPKTVGSASADCENRKLDLAILGVQSSHVDVSVFELGAGATTLFSSSQQGPFAFPPRDVAWCPDRHTSADSNCLLVASKSAPVLLWDCDDCCSRASYRAFDEMDELVAPHSLLWSKGLRDGTNFVAGYGGVANGGNAQHVRCFDVCNEGRNAVWSYTSRLVENTSAIVSSLFVVAGQPQLLGVGWAGCSFHYAELIDLRHKGLIAAALNLQSVPHCASRPSGFSGQVRQHPDKPGVFFTRPRVEGSSCIAEWDVRRLSAPTNLFCAPVGLRSKFDVPSGFDVVSVNGTTYVVDGVRTSADEFVVHSTACGASCDSDVASSRSSCATVTSVVEVLSQPSSNRVEVLVGGSPRSFSLRDRYEENAGKGVSKRSRTVTNDDVVDISDVDEQKPPHSAAPLQQIVTLCFPS